MDDSTIVLLAFIHDIDTCELLAVQCTLLLWPGLHDCTQLFNGASTMMLETRDVHVDYFYDDVVQIQNF